VGGVGGPRWGVVLWGGGRAPGVLCCFISERERAAVSISYTGVAKSLNRSTGIDPSSTRT
jgi:hypothetical protein